MPMQPMLLPRARAFWKLMQSPLVQAVKFPVDHGISFNKDLTLPSKVLCRFFIRFRLTLRSGINNFNNKVVLKELLLPSDNQLGGIDFVATTSLHNLRYYQKNQKRQESVLNASLSSPFAL